MTTPLAISSMMMVIGLHPIILIVLLSLGSQITEARIGSLQVRNGAIKFFSRSQQPSITYSESEANHHPLLFLEDSLDLSSSSSSSNSRRKNSNRRSTPITSNLRTDVADLASDFQSAIHAFNQDDKDIHVGRLLAACERLEGTMEKIGFHQGAKDIGGNIRKIRNMYSRAPPGQRDCMPELLRYEMSTGIHNESKGIRRIKDPSAAVGFLWLGRTLNYQYDMFRLMLDENEEPYHAARRAYDQDLRPHHSWAVQKACQAAMFTLKPMKKSAVLSSLGGFEEDRYGVQENEATYRDMHQMMDSWKPLLTRWKKVFTDLGLETI